MHRPKGLTFEFTSNGIGAIRIRIDYAQQPHRLSLQFEFFVDSGMIASKNAHAHHGDGDRIMRWQKSSRVAVAGTIVNAKLGKGHLHKGS